MKTTIKTLDYDKVMALPRPQYQKPRKPNLFWRTLIRILTIFGMMGSGFRYETEGFEKLKKGEPCLILMNHTCFLDMEIAYRILYPRAFNIVCSNDGFIGFFGLMEWLMRSIGCIPTQKFVTDLRLIQDMEYCFKTLGTSVLMYPEAGYSFDGRATTLPRKMGVLLKKFDVPVIMIETFGLFSRNPLYNELQIRKNSKVSAKAYVLYTRDEIHEKSVKELSDGIDAAFGFDHFKWQKEQGLQIDQPFRADGLDRILYKCAACGQEGKMRGKGTELSCGCCGKRWELTPLGQLNALEGETEFSHIPDWYTWEREEVQQEILDGKYLLDTDVQIAMQVDYKAIYMVGEGHLTHDRSGFTLTGCDGKLNYSQKPQSCYGLYADYYWYEIADCICIGDSEVHYFLFPKDTEISVAKIRLATEEMYKLYKARRLNAGN
ncbi:MAG: 1-acyl-sn-glycerol-3-phosphate acyltransferase [Lachnospiraceae bacterium]|nr:1-acyl-sn-glycerol-3-phosphate acyltransferase [Lachnospiraceae bacterium]